MNRKTHSTKIRNTKKRVLKIIVSSAIILSRKVAGLIMQGLKQFWQNWQWVLALVALLFSAFTYYYKTSTEIPARIADCEQHIIRHEQESKEHFAQLDKSVADLNILNKGIQVQLESIKDDTSATKRLLFELLGKKL